MSKIDPTQAAPISNKRQPTALPVITRIRLPQRLRHDGWWLCPAPERPTARILQLPQRLMPHLERARHD